MVYLPLFTFIWLLFIVGKYLWDCLNDLWELRGRSAKKICEIGESKNKQLSQDSALNSAMGRGKHAYLWLWLEVVCESDIQGGGPTTVIHGVT